MDKNQLKNELQKIIIEFKNSDGYKRSEANTEAQFTVPVLHLLGWEKKNIFINEARRTQKSKRPDILLKYEDTGTDLLIIESKEASGKDTLDGSYPGLKFTDQLYGYCEDAGLFWGILTNFVEWRVYNSHQQALYKNKKYAFFDLLWEGANKNNYIDLMSDEGLEFLNRLSFENLTEHSGKIDADPIYYPVQKDLEEDKIKEEFFIGIKKWRSALVKYISKNFTTENVDIVAQQILDRVIFIEICHDKGIIGQDILSEILKSQQNKYAILKDKFRTMDDLFNSELFLSSEADGLDIGDEVSEKILTEISAIDFSKLSVHIIGEIYERFLGEIKRGTTKEKEKEKKQEQGVYYTPTYVVEYMVKNTVGQILSSVSTEADLKKIRIIDPACGSGSFLISVFDEFLTAYKRVCGKSKSSITLFEFDLKKQILQNNIFGVDLDNKAVEITKLNLLIKALEGLRPQDLKDSKHLLPNLGLNIRCGNSLIGGDVTKIDNDCKAKISNIINLKNDIKTEQDYEKSKQLMKTILDEEYFINNRLNQWIDEKTRNKKHPFNYEVAFCEVFKEGGFDCVIGNPPYLKEGRVDKTVFDGLHTNPYYQGKMDIWYIFGSKSIDLLKDGGLHSFIATNNWITSSGASKLRDKVVSETKISLFIDFNNYMVFKPKASQQTMIYILKKDPMGKSFQTDYYKILDNKISDKEVIDFLHGISGNLKIINFKSRIDRQKTLDKNISFSNAVGGDLLDKIKNNSNFVLLDDEVSNGFHDHHGKVNKERQEILAGKHKVGEGIFVLNNEEKNNLYLTKAEQVLIKPAYTTEEIDRYYANNKNKEWLIYTTSDFKDISKMKVYPNIKKHLDKFEQVITSDNRPYGLHRAKEERFFKGEKIIAPRKCLIPGFSYVDFDSYVSATFYIIKTNRIDNKYLTGLLNSHLIQYWLKNKGKMQGSNYQLDKAPLMDLPLYQPTKTQEEEYKRIIDFVQKIQNKKKETENKDTPATKNWEEEINLIVYKMYDVGKDEQKIIEQNIKGN